MKKLLTITLLGLTLLAGCKKEKFDLPEESISETPIFSVKGTIGETPVDMVAGVDGAYMETSVKLFHGIEFFTGKMLKDSQAFTLSVSNGQIGLIPAFPTAIPSSVLFAYPPQTWITAHHQALPNADKIQSVNFTVDGISQGSSLNSSIPGFHNICADIVFYDGSTHTICNKLLLGYKDYGGFVVGQALQAGNSTSLWLEAAATPVQSVKWFVNGQLYSENQEITLAPGNGVVQVKAVVTFSNGLVREHTVLTDTDGEGRSFADFESFKTAVEDVYYHDFRISVAFQDDLNALSGYATADLPGEFIINSVSLFDEKLNGNKVYKVVGTINGKMYDNVTGDLLPSHLEVTFALEMPY